MLIYLRSGARKRMIAILALVLVLVGARIGVSFYGEEEQAVAKITPLSRIRTTIEAVGVIVDVSGASAEHITAALTSFENAGVKATWFVDATLTESNKDAVMAIVENGHELGVKGTDDKAINKLTALEIKDRLTRSRQALVEMGIEPVPFLYPPAGKYSDTVVSVAFQEGYQSIKPAIDATTIKGKEDVAAVKTAEEVKAGDLILLKVGKKGFQPGEDYLVSLVAALKEREFEVVMLTALVKGIN